MEVTKEIIESIIIGFFKYAGYNQRINLAQAHYACNWLSNHCGIIATTLFVQETWNKYIEGGNNNENH